jgi:hypothetical protein
MAASSAVAFAGVSVSLGCEKMEFRALSSSFRAPGVVGLSKATSYLQREVVAVSAAVHGRGTAGQICAKRPALHSSFLAKPVAARGLPPFAPLETNLKNVLSPKKGVVASPVCMAAAYDAEGASVPE